jgi:hypothetical protein
MSSPVFLFNVNSNKWNLSREITETEDKTTMQENNFRFTYSRVESERGCKGYVDTCELQTAEALYRRTIDSQLVQTKFISVEILLELDLDDSEESYIRMYILRDQKNKIVYKTSDYKNFYERLVEVFEENTTTTPRSHLFDLHIDFGNYAVNVGSEDVSLEIKSSVVDDSIFTITVYGTKSIYLKKDDDFCWYYDFAPGVLTTTYVEPDGKREVIRCY